MTSLSVSTPPATLAHLERLSDQRGIVEHAYLAEPRSDASYCTDDAGRLLALVAHMHDHRYARHLAVIAVNFLERAYRGDASFLLRHDERERWSDEVSDDATGRALLGLAHAAAYAPWPGVQRRSLALFTRAVNFRSDHLRAAAYATLASAVLLQEIPDHEGARLALEESPDFVVTTDNVEVAWLWPEARLSYANALLPLAHLARANALQDHSKAADALAALEWLCGVEMLEDHFSFTPVDGRGPRDHQARFDQQPIEAWAMTEACVFAYEYTRDATWLERARLAGSWFLAANDVGVLVYDPVSGGGYDGLEATGVNLNQGAESTLSFVATMRELHALESSHVTPRSAEETVSLQATSRKASSR
ncbi:MAG: glycosyltransferase [Acidobacteria bacterium]|nr:glycosyltransferase [Acidobacteriota bacterium]